ncbi:MAG: peptidoglycan DD-metalloendopeptidase family protein [Gammaproteobacteria bacterium]|nr:peptidoglycan DD-metalloendopeptidase family protein [Gammaproteobacteria bacterium]
MTRGPLTACRWLLLATALLIHNAGPAVAADDDITHTRQELEQLRTRIQALRATLANEHAAQNELVNSLKTSEQAIGRINQRLRRLDADVEAHNAQLARLQQDRGRLADAMSAQRNTLAAQIRAAYLMGRQDRLKLLLNQQDPARVGRSLIYYDYLNRVRTGHIVRAETDLARMAAAEHAIGQQRMQLAKLHRAQQQEKEILDEGQQARTLILARLNTDIQRKDTDLARLLEDERALDALLQRLTSAPRPPDSPSHTAFAALKGALPWPAPGTVTAPSSERSRAQGVLIEGHAGDTVQAVSPGRVVFAEWLRGFGLLTIIDHGDGYMTLYGHNQALYKGVGDWVEAGESIAAMGVSGSHKRPGVYFEIREQGLPRDPLAWCLPQEPKRGSNN